MSRAGEMAPRVLMVHTRYLQPGGEDTVFESETALLREHGVEVTILELSNLSLAGRGALELGLLTTWSRPGYRSISEAVREGRPDVVHFHNTFPYASPAAYYAARRGGAAVVQTLHNFRLVCLNATLLRQGAPCEACVGMPVAVPGVIHGCYRGSRAASVAVATMLAAHRSLGTWRQAVDRYIALTEFAAARFVRGGLPADRIAVKPNFLPRDPGAGSHDGPFALLVGRCSPEKGVLTAVEAWRDIGHRVELRIVGSGPQAEEVARQAATLPGVSYMGALRREQVLDLMKRARLLVVPSTWYEGFPMVVIEAFATGLPVVASSLGGLEEIFEGRGGGALFRPGDPADLARRVNELLDEPAVLHRMGRMARDRYVAEYSAEATFPKTMQVYEEALRVFRGDHRDR